MLLDITLNPWGILTATDKNLEGYMLCVLHGIEICIIQLYGKILIYGKTIFSLEK